MKTSHVKQDYPGGKGASGAAQQLINLMPPHTQYIELFAGGGFIFRLKKPAEINTAVDIDAKAIIKLGLHFSQFATENLANPSESEPNTFCFKINSQAVILTTQDAFEYLDRLQQFTEDWSGMLIYADPPYVPATLASRQRYKYGFDTDAHEALLKKLAQLPCYVMISGYDSALYNRMLPDWKTHTFNVRTRAATGTTTRTETVWMNYDIAAFDQRHDYRFLGNTFRERERIRKQQRRWAAKFNRMSPLLRNAMLDKLTSTIK